MATYFEIRLIKILEHPSSARMSHNEKRTVWYKEALYSLITGFLYGGTNTISGHPFDTVKTKMQA